MGSLDLWRRHMIGDLTDDEDSDDDTPWGSLGFGGHDGASPVAPADTTPMASRPELKPLIVTKVDLQQSENLWTEANGENLLFIRRGQQLNMHVYLSREYNPRKDTISLEFTTGVGVEDGTLSYVPIGGDAKATTVEIAVKPPESGGDVNTWSAVTVLNDTTMNKLIIQVAIPLTAAIGGCEIAINTQTKGNDDHVWRKHVKYKHGGAKMVVINAYDEEQQLTVTEVDLLNEHGADEKKNVHLVSRGQPFGMRAILSREYKPGVDTIIVELTAGGEGAALSHIPLGEDHATHDTVELRYISGVWQNMNGWSAEIVHHDTTMNEFVIQITSSTSAVIGAYEISIYTHSNEDDGAWKRRVKGKDGRAKMVVLFNAFIVEELLTVTQVDLLKEHTIDEQEKKLLIIGVGQQFQLLVKLNRMYKQHADAMSLEFTAGAKGATLSYSSLGRDNVTPTTVELPVASEGTGNNADGWSAVIVKNDRTTRELTIQVTTSPYATAGAYQLWVNTQTVGNDNVWREQVKDQDGEEKVVALFSSGEEPAIVIGVDMLKSVNRRNHHTEAYEMKSLIVRRGKPIDLSVALSREYDPDKHTIHLEFTAGRNASVPKSTMIQLIATPSGSPHCDEWSAMISSSYDEKTRCNLQVTAPTSAIIGDYKFSIYAATAGADSMWKRRVKENNKEAKIILLFNPFTQDDDCYMEHDEERNEYVMNDEGHIWVGSAWSNRGKPWIFGQFDKVALRAALFLLRKSGLLRESWGSLVGVTRTISKLVNSNDDQGVLMGNWSGEYESGTSPSAWGGSIAILEKYMKKKQPVKYGQCWVFSGVLTTVCRALGIPTRSVTNFESAHDTDASMTIDTYINNPSGNYRDDSVWNFHVWNECFFKRPDLCDSGTYDGWQVLDATPQETSGGSFQCGPAPVVAIKHGDINVNHDCGFVLGEVNGDKCRWLCLDDGRVVPIKIDKHAVGKNISTQSTEGDGKRLDITRNYKYPEGSVKERDAVKRAFSHGSIRERRIYDIPANKDFNIAARFRYGVKVGSDVKGEFEFRNNSNRILNLGVTFKTCLVLYTGRPVYGSSREETRDVQVGANKKHNVDYVINAAEYEEKLMSNSALCIFAVVTEKRADCAMTVDTAEDKVVFNTPGVSMEVPRQVQRNTEFDVKVKIVNPLSKSVLNCASFSYEGKGLEPKDGECKLCNPIKPGEEATAKFTIKATRSGRIVVNFSSRELSECDAVAWLRVE